jgi:high-affinity iron transporter
MMLAPFLIMLREGLEAALVVGIIASYLRQSGRAGWLPTIWIGVFLAIAVSFLVGALLQFASAEFPQKAQELFEAAVGLVAVVLLTSMVFWMRKAARSIKAQLQHSIDDAMAVPAGATWALIGMAFFAVAREGLESIFFLLAIFQQSPGPDAALGAMLGLVLSLVLGVAIYYGGVQINLRRFFRWTGVFILFVAAGLLASVLRNLHEAGVWNLLQTQVYDMSEVLPVSSLAGTIMSGIFNYQDTPTLGEVIVYVGFLAVTLVLFFRSEVVVTGKTIVVDAGRQRS